jgi:hypothetical protein
LQEFNHNLCHSVFQTQRIESQSDNGTDRLWVCRFHKPVHIIKFYYYYTNCSCEYVKIALIAADVEKKFKLISMTAFSPFLNVLSFSLLGTVPMLFLTSTENYNRLKLNLRINFSWCHSNDTPLVCIIFFSLSISSLNPLITSVFSFRILFNVSAFLSPGFRSRSILSLRTVSI